jgi:hypothetical protein
MGVDTLRHYHTRALYCGRDETVGAFSNLFATLLVLQISLLVNTMVISRGG